MPNRNLNSFIIGAGSIFDLFGSYYANSNPLGKIKVKSDYDAMLSDWTAVGDDIRAAINTYNEQHKVSTSK